MTAKPRMLLCFCGCGQPVRNADRKYLQGHNSRRTVRSQPHMDDVPAKHHVSELQGVECWSPPYAEAWAQTFRARGGKLAFWKSGEVTAKMPDGTLETFETYDAAEQGIGRRPHAGENHD